MLTVSVTTGTGVTTLVAYNSIRLTRDCDHRGPTEVSQITLLGGLCALSPV